MNNRSLFVWTFIVFGIAFIMPIIASSIGMRIHGDAKATDAGIAPLLIGLYNIPFMIAAAIALIVGASLKAKSKFASADKAYITVLVICGASLMMVVPWGLMQ